MISGIPILQQWRDYAPNLFEVTIFGDNTDPNKTYLGNAPKFYCTSFNLPAPSLELERHSFTKQFFIKSYGAPDQLTIKWREDENLSVMRYHNNWIACFYDRWSDTYITGAENKKRNVTIELQHWDAAKKKYLDDGLSPFIEINVMGLIPTAGIELMGDWDVSSSDNAFKEVTYKFDYWEYSVAKNLPLFSMSRSGDNIDDVPIKSGAANGIVVTPPTIPAVADADTTQTENTPSNVPPTVNKGWSPDH